MSVAKSAKGPSTRPNSSLSTTPAVIRTGTLAVGERTTFGGRVWRSRGVVLNATDLTIHYASRPASLPLSSVTALERTDLMPHSLSLECGSKTYHLSFKSDGELYDWQDDIYTRCPLGAQTTKPFNFQHTAHIGSNGAMGTFSEPATLPMFEEVMGRTTSRAQAVSLAAPTALVSAKPPSSARRRSNPLKGMIILDNRNDVNIEGAFFVRQTGMFVGWYWKERWVSLKGTSLTIHTRKTKASPPAKEISLSTMRSVEPDPKRSNCLLLGTTQRETCISILFPTDGDMYAWREAIYLRSGLSSIIGLPTNVVHAMHVSYDKSTGELKGLPDQWKNDPSLSTPLVAKISIGNTASHGRSPRRRSQPPRIGNEVQEMSPTTVTITMKSATPSPVAQSRSSMQQSNSSLSVFSTPPASSGAVATASSIDRTQLSVGSLMSQDLDGQGTLGRLASHEHGDA